MLQTADADAKTTTVCLPACGSFSCSAAAAVSAEMAADADLTAHMAKRGVHLLHTPFILFFLLPATVFYL